VEEKAYYLGFGFHTYFFILGEYQIWRGFEGFRETEEKKNRIVKYAEEKRGRLRGVSGIWRGRWYRILKACF